MRVPENFCYYMALHKDCKEWQIEAARNLKSTDLEISTNSKETNLRKMVYSVLNEVHRMMAFVRLRSEGDRILWGYLKPRHKIGEHISRHFAKRNPGIVILLGNGSESWASLCWDGEVQQSNGGGLNENLEILKSLLNCSNEFREVESLWQIYYDSQYCSERKNLAAFCRHMPKKDQKAAKIRLVEDNRRLKLHDFMVRD